MGIGSVSDTPRDVEGCGVTSRLTPLDPSPALKSKRRRTDLAEASGTLARLLDILLKLSDHFLTQIDGIYPVRETKNTERSRNVLQEGSLETHCQSSRACASRGHCLVT